MAAEFKPVKLTRNGKNRVARSATEEAELRYDGWHSLQQIRPDERNKAARATASAPAETPVVTQSPKKS